MNSVRLRQLNLPQAANEWHVFDVYIRRPAHWTLARCLTAFAGVGILIAFAPGPVATATPDRIYPTQLAGWPGGTSHSYGSTAQAARSYVGKAKQYSRLPISIGALQVRNTPSTSDSTCTVDPPWMRHWNYKSRMTAVSPEGSPYPTGIFPDATVRTVAFGAVPVEATVTMSQPRDADDLPVPVEIDAPASQYCAGEQYRPFPNLDGSWTGQMFKNYGANGSGPLTIGIKRLSIDGVPITLSASCKTVKPATLHIESLPYTQDDPNIPLEDHPLLDTHNTTPYYNQFAAGGRLFGNVEIPPFTGCVTASGDDLSALLSASISGTANEIEARTGPPGSRGCWPTRDSTCVVPDPIPIPDRP